MDTISHLRKLAFFFLMVSWSGYNSFAQTTATEQQVEKSSVEVSALITLPGSTLGQARATPTQVVVPDSNQINIVSPPPSFSARSYTTPRSPIATIEYKIPVAMRVKVYVYSTDGAYSKLHINKMHEPGIFREYFDGAEHDSGLYMGRIVAGDNEWIEPILLVK